MEERLVNNFLATVPGFAKKVEDYYAAANTLGLEEWSYCLTEMAEGSFEWYQAVAKACKHEGVKRVFDIGANIGVQRYFFESLGIEYVPVDEYEMANINGSLDGLINKKYPFEIHAKEDDALISHLCIGYLVNFCDCYKKLFKFNHLFFNKEMADETKKYKKIVMNHQYYGTIYYYKKWSN